MKFKYSDYFACIVIQALILFIVGIATTIFLTISLVNSFNPLSLLGVIVIAVFLTISVSWLKYGIYLLREKESDAIETTGQIEKIEKVFQSPRYYSNKKIMRAKLITINNKKLYFMTDGDLKIGDVVKIKFLPKSTIVLEVELQKN